MKKELLTRGVEEIIVRSHLEKRLKSGKKLRVKLGIDPTAPDLHIGHTVVLRKLRAFQDAGHKAILIVGDYTATIGDPSGKNELRPMLTEAEIKQNMKNYIKEAGKVLDIEKAEIRYNSEWFKKKGLEFIFELTSKFTVARIMEREDFKNRIKKDQDLSLLEILYPLLQGYDSVETKADVELGGTDQKFNLLTGRKAQRRFGVEEQDIVMMPLLEGTDGEHKMSKSLGNYIGLSEAPEEMYGKLMSISDDLIEKYFLLTTSLPESEIKQILKGHPKTAKAKLAKEIVTMYHSAESADKAEKEFEKKFGKKKGEIKADETLSIKVAEKIKAIDEILVEGGLASSKSEARRKIGEGAVDINGKKVNDPKSKPKLKKKDLIRLGKRFLRIK